MVSLGLVLELVRDLISADEPARQRAAAEARELLPALEEHAARVRATEPAPDAHWEDDPPLWEHQGGPLTVGDLRWVWTNVRADLPVVVSVYDAAGSERRYRPMEIGLAGQGARPEMVVVTVA